MTILASVSTCRPNSPRSQITDCIVDEPAAQRRESRHASKTSDEVAVDLEKPHSVVGPPRRLSFAKSLAALRSSLQRRTTRSMKLRAEDLVQMCHQLGRGAEISLGKQAVEQALGKDGPFAVGELRTRLEDPYGDAFKMVLNSATGELTVQRRS